MGQMLDRLLVTCSLHCVLLTKEHELWNDKHTLAKKQVLRRIFDRERQTQCI